MQSKITIIITAYNLENSIAQCLEELEGQTFTDFNIIVTDDCSTDNTREVIDNYKSLYSNISTIYCEKNHGTPAALRNLALSSEFLYGEYALFLDGDDNIEPDMLEKLYSAAVNENADIVCCAYNRIDQRTKEEYSKEMLHFFVHDIEHPQNAGYIPFVNGSLWNKLISVKIIGDRQLPVMRVGEDASFVLELLMSSRKTVFIDNILIHYNVTGKSLMSTIPKEQIYKFAEELVRQYKLAANENRKIIALSAFIHIGISMTSRAYQSKNINTHEHLKWTKKYFNENFPGWFSNEYLRLGFLKKFGIRGVAIWGCKILLKINCLRIFLWAYSFMINVIGKDLKW